MGRKVEVHLGSYITREVHYLPNPKANNEIAFLQEPHQHPFTINCNYLSRLPFTSVQITQQSEVAVGESVAVFLLQTLAVNWIDGGEVAAVHRGPSLPFSQNQRHQLGPRTFIQSASVLQVLLWLKIYFVTINREVKPHSLRGHAAAATTCLHQPVV